MGAQFPVLALFPLPSPRVNSHPKGRDEVGLSPPVLVLIPAPITCEGNSLLPAHPGAVPLCIPALQQLFLTILRASEPPGSSGTFPAAIQPQCGTGNPLEVPKQDTNHTLRRSSAGSHKGQNPKHRVWCLGNIDLGCPCVPPLLSAL